MPQHICLQESLGLSPTTLITPLSVNATAVPPPFRLGELALCGSHPLVTPLLVYTSGFAVFFVCSLIVSFCYLCIFVSFSTLILLVGSFDL